MKGWVKIMNANDILKAMNDISDATLKESGQVKAQRKSIRFRRTAALIAAAAAALALTVTAGAVVYKKVTHNEYYHENNVEHFVAGGNELSGMEAIKLDSEHYELTIDDLWSDGNIATAIVTARWKDEEGKKTVEMLDCSTGYADEPFTQDTHLTSSGRFCWENEYDAEKPELTEDSTRYYFYFHCYSIDRSRNINLYFFREPEDYTVEYEIVPDIIAEVSFEKNLDTVDFYSDDGYVVSLSPIGLYQHLGIRPSPHGNSGLVYLIRNDGQEPESHLKLLLGVYGRFSDSDPDECYYNATFQHTVDPTEYKAIRIGNVEYTRK